MGTETKGTRRPESKAHRGPFRGVITVAATVGHLQEGEQASLGAAELNGWG
jgi:hypothetical protein